MKKTNFTIRALILGCLIALTGGWASAQIDVAITINGGTFPGEVGVEMVNISTGNSVEFCRQPGQVGGGTNNFTASLPQGNYEVYGYDSFGDGWNGANITVTGPGINFGPATFTSGGTSNSCNGVASPGGAFLGAFAAVIPDCQITCPADITVPTDNGVCGANVNVPQPSINSDCAGIISQELSSPVTPYQFVGVMVNTPTTVSGVVASSGDVTLTVFRNGDHDFGFTERFRLAGPDGSIIFTANSGQCANATSSFTVAQATWNNWVNNFSSGGDMEFVALGNSGINNICAGDEFQVSASVLVPPTLDYVNDYNGTDDASDFYPEGTTEVEFLTQDPNGFPVTCTFTVTVVDVQGPVFANCPSNIVVNLDPGACEQIVDFGPLEVSDNCGLPGGDLEAPVQFPASFANHGGGTVFSLQGNNASGGVYFDLTNNSTEEVFIGGFGVRFGNPAFGVVTAPKTLQIFTADTWNGNATNPGAWTDLGPAVVDPIPPYFATGTGDLGFAELTSQVSLAPGQTRGFHIFGQSACPIFNWAFGGAINPITNGIFTVGAGPISFNQLGNLFQNGPIGMPNIHVFYAFPGSGVVQTDNTGLTSGDFFPRGETCLSFEAEDVGGNIGTCEFCIIVKEYPTPIQSMTCNDMVNISLEGETCTEIVNADLVLEGGPYGCYDDYDVNLYFDEGKNNPVNNNSDNDELNGDNVGQTLTVEVIDPETGVSCWGKILVEDKVPPVIECKDLTIECNDALPTEPAPLFSGPVRFEIEPNDVIPTVPATFEYEFDYGFFGNAPTEDVDVIIDMTHTWHPDLDIVVETPGGKQQDVYAIGGCFGQAFTINCIFDDEGQGGITSCFDIDADGMPIQCFQLPGVQNNTILANLDGEVAGGVWKVIIRDNVSGDGGPIRKVGLIVTATSPQVLPEDACAGVLPFTFTDEVTKLGCDSDFSEIITRTYFVDDGNGNTATCNQTISRARGDILDVVVPPFWDDVDAPVRSCANPCTEPQYFPGNSCYDGADPFGYGGGTGFPTNLCSDVQYYYEDSPEIGLPDCAAGYKILRSWTLIDWCTQQILTYDQLIKVNDFTAPNLNCPTQPISVSVDNNCSGNVSVGFIANMVGASDDCSSMSFSVTIGGTTYTGGQIITGLPVGTTPATVTATDACGNESSCNITLRIEDLIPPVAICDEFTTIGLGNLLYDADPFTPGLDANAELCFQTVDDGSYDNCDILAIKLRRMDGKLGSNTTPQFKDCVYFNCADIGSSIMVQMRVYDKTGSFNNVDPFARYNECMVEVEVVDKVNPVIACPPSKTVECWEYKTEEVDGLLAISLADLNALNASNGSTGYPPNIPPAYLTVRKIDALTGQIKSQQYVGYVGGYPQATDNCKVDSVQIIVNENIDNCGEGNVTRFYRAYEPIDVGETTPDFSQCVQSISIQHTTPFDICDTQPWNTPALGCGFGHSLEDGVEWPADIDLVGCNLGLLPEDLEQDPSVNPNDVRPRVFDDFCDLIGVDYEDTYLVLNGQAGPSGCIKLVRKWILVDWCQEDASFDLGYKTWTFNQEIKVLESAAPSFDAGACDDVTICMDDDICNYVVSDVLEVTASDDCTPEEHLNYYYKLDAFNDGIGAFGGYDFTSDFTYRDGDNRNFPSPPNILDTLNHDDNPATTNIVEGKFPAGVHRLFWKVEDACGNVTTCQYTFEVKDCKKPTPVCHNSIVTVVMPTSGEVSLFSSYFDAGSYDNCTDDADLVIAFSDNVTFNPFTGEPIYDTVRTFNCDDVGPALDIEVWVKDAPVGYDDNDVLDDNWDYCVTQVIIQDPNGVCGTSDPTAAVEGSINTEYNVPVGQVDVIANMNNGLTKTMTTQADGKYSFDLNVGMNHSIEPTKDMNYKNGVSTYDLVLISQHIIGTLPLNSPYKIIAADANNDQKVTVFDILELRKLILGLTDDLAENTSWRFVDASYVFPNASNPFQPAFPEVIDINNLTIDELNNNFVGVKIGDVSNDVVANNLISGSVDARNFNGEVVLGVKDVDMEAGETYTVEFTASDFRNIKGYQFTVAFNAEVLSFVDVTPGMLTNLTEGNFGLTKSAEGMILTSWNAENASLNDGDVVFSLTFAARENARLSDVIAINSSEIAAEAYTAVDFKNVALRFDTDNGSTVVGPAFELFQNQPNPFKSETLIGFNLPEATEATLKIFDVSGKVLKVFKGDYAQGTNYLTIDRSELGATAGVLYYQLETADNSATKKMIIIE
jgi:subtilisin-like proprotein convertase family protein